MKAAARAILFSFALAVGSVLPGLSQDAGEYVIGPKDLLEIRVFEIPELNLERRVTDGGTIDLPMLGELPVSGQTAAQVRDRLTTVLTEKYVYRANVSIIVKEFASKPISILGAVQKPGSLNISGRWTLLEAISAAGGLTEAAGRTIYVLRKAENGLSDTLQIDREALFRGGAAGAMWNIPIVPSDIVNVAPKSIVTVFCLGEVKQSGAMEFNADDRISLLSVIAKAGGLSERASSTIRIKRRGANGKDDEIQVNFKRIVKGKDPDPVLKADDVIIVKESFF